MMPAPPRKKLRTWLTYRLLHSVNRLVRPLTMGVRGVVIDAENRVLLVRHTYLPGWHSPGGGVEPGETVLEALTHELREEGNIEMTGEPALHGVFFNDSVSRRDHVIVYVVRAFRQTAPRPADREIAEARFFPVDALPEGTVSATRARIAEILQGAPRAANW